MLLFEGSDEVDRGDIDTAMEENGIGIRVDSFLDESMIQACKRACAIYVCGIRAINLLRLTTK